MIDYRVVHDPDELKEIVTAQGVVWSMPLDEAVPDNMLMAVIHSGGVVIRADEAGRLVGFAMALVALRGRDLILWSHMAGVIPSHQGQGVGFGLKQAQRRWALEHGFPVMAWTFDPMQRRNANFNLHRLRAVSSTYLVNFYGAMNDGINQGMPSDRLEVTWNLLAEPVVAAASAAPPAVAAGDHPQEAFLLYGDADGQPRRWQPDSLTAFRYGVEIPYHLAALKRDDIERAKAWQIALRQTLQAAFAQGYAAVDFAADGQRCWYVLEQTPGRGS
jgi:predicted GNAT superfamily acetyltransferase